MRKRLLIIFYLVFLSFALYSQTKLSGVVVSSDDGKPIPNAHISLLNPSDKSIIVYAFI